MAKTRTHVRLYTYTRRVVRATTFFPLQFIAVDVLNEITYGGKVYYRVLIDKEETRFPKLYILKTDAEELLI
jgi:hypothetical protein